MRHCQPCAGGVTLYTIPYEAYSRISPFSTEPQPASNIGTLSANYSAVSKHCFAYMIKTSFECQEAL